MTRYTEDDCKQALQGVAGERETISRPMYKQERADHHPSPSTIERMFGTWNSALQEVSLVSKYRSDYSREEVKRAIKAVKEKLGRPPSVNEYEQHRELHHPSNKYIKQNLGWSTITDELGFNAYNNYQEEQLIECISDAAEKLGCSPTRDEYDEHRPDSYPSSPTIARRIGWNEAKRRADIKQYHEGNGLRYPYGPRWESVREKILDRDNHCCVNCRMTADEHKQEHAYSLHVHHQIKIRTFFEDFTDKELEQLNSDNPSETLVQRARRQSRLANHETNLVTLCLNCHNRLEDKPLDEQLEILKE